MGNVKTGILSDISGAVGPIVGAVLKGLNVIRKLPAKSSKAATQGQIDQRLKFALIMQLVRTLSEVIQTGFQSFTGLVSPRNGAMSYNLKHAITGVSPTFAVDYDKVLISKGPLINGSELELTDLGARKLQITWDLANCDSKAKDKIRETDICNAIFYSEERGMFMESVDILRSAKTLDTTISKYFAGMYMHVFVFFVSADGKLVSNSQYLGKVLITK